MKQYLRLIKYIKPHATIFIWAFVLMIFSQLFQPVSLGALIPFINRVMLGNKITIPNANLPAFIYQWVDKINSIPQLKLLTMFVVFYAILMLLRSVLTYIQTYLMREVSQQVVKDIRDSIYEKLLNLSMKFYSSSKTGTLMSRITYDSTVVQDAVAEGLTDLISQSLLFIFSLITLIVMAWIYAIPKGLVLASVILPTLIIGPIVKMSKHLRKISRKTQETMADINNALFETISGISIVKAFSMEQYEHNRFKDKSLAYKKAVMKSNQKILAIGPITELTGAICGLLVMWYIGREVIVNKVDFAVLIPFFLCLMSLVKPISRLSKVHSINQQALGAASRIFEILDTRSDVEEKPDAMVLPRVKESVEFKNVQFTYGDKSILKNINLKVDLGQIVAFVGPSGAGKTTLVNLIPRFYDPQEGSVTVDHYNLKDVTLKSLREQIGIVTQDTILFNDTVYNNISYGNSAVSEDKVIQAAKAANAHDFITKMPQGYDTIIGERGFKVSGGEKQRLAIARAIFKNPPILIFDEATSQLDSQSEVLVQDAIDKLISGRTVFIIAHRLSTIKYASKIMVMDKGEIVDTGTHEELVSREGLYKKLYNMQFRGL